MSDCQLGPDDTQDAIRALYWACTKLLKLVDEELTTYQKNIYVAGVRADLEEVYEAFRSCGIVLE